jgi:leucyl-tRNA synthetase
MFIGPMDGSPDFRDSGIEGMQRFMNRVWGLFSETLSHSSRRSSTFLETTDTTKKSASSASNRDSVLSTLHLTIKGVTEDMEQFKYNTAISKIMQLVNTFVEYKVQSGEQALPPEYLEKLALLLAPFAPHMMEEVWGEVLGQPFSIHKAEWPEYEEKYTQVDKVIMVIQVNGKVRSQLAISNSQLAMNKEEIEQMAKKDEKVAKWLDGNIIKKTIFIPGKVINFVI